MKPCSLRTGEYTSHRMPPVQYISTGVSFGTPRSLSSTVCSPSVCPAPRAASPPPEPSAPLPPPAPPPPGATGVWPKTDSLGRSAPSKCPASHSYEFRRSTTTGRPGAPGASRSRSSSAARHSAGDTFRARLPGSVTAGNPPCCRRDTSALCCTFRRFPGKLCPLAGKSRYSRPWKGAREATHSAYAEQSATGPPSCAFTPSRDRKTRPFRSRPRASTTALWAATSASGSASGARW